MGSQRFFDENGFDLWGYDLDGHYDSAHDRAPFQNSPWPTCPACDACEPCTREPGVQLVVWKAPARV